MSRLSIKLWSSLFPIALALASPTWAINNNIEITIPSKAKGQKAELVTWEQLDALFKTIGEQTRCHLDNNKLTEDEKRQDCDSIVVEPVSD